MTRSICEAIDYCPLTGEFRWKIACGAAKAGELAGGIGTDGYRRIGFGGKRYQAHRVAWLIMTGRWPEILVDHRNLDILDNRWENLREATVSQNGANSAARNRHLPKGVTRHETGRFQAQIRARGKNHYLGLFDDPYQAHAAYVTAAERLHGEFARAA